MKLCRLVNGELPRISAAGAHFPVAGDHVVHPSNAPYILEHIGSAERAGLAENSYHVATLDYDKELIFEKTVQFMRRHSKSRGGDQH